MGSTEVFWNRLWKPSRSKTVSPSMSKRLRLSFSGSSSRGVLWRGWGQDFRPTRGCCRPKMKPLGGCCGDSAVLHPGAWWFDRTSVALRCCCGEARSGRGDASASSDKRLPSWPSRLSLHRKLRTDWLAQCQYYFCSIEARDQGSVWGLSAVAREYQAAFL